MHFLLCVLLCLLCSLLTYKETRGIVGNKKKAVQNKDRTMNKQHKQVNSTNNNSQQQNHTCFLFCGLLRLFCSILTYRGTCGTVGNKKSNTKQAQGNEQTTKKKRKQQQTTTNTYMCFWVCVLLCLSFSILTYKGTCGTVGNRKKQNKTDTEKHEHTTQKKQTAQTTTNNNKNIHVFVLCFVIFVLFYINL